MEPTCAMPGLMNYGSRYRNIFCFDFFAQGSLYGLLDDMRRLLDDMSPLDDMRLLDDMSPLDGCVDGRSCLCRHGLDPSRGDFRGCGSCCRNLRECRNDRCCCQCDGSGDHGDFFHSLLKLLI